MCDHCWHSMGEYSDTTGMHRSEKCCHCGEYRTIDLTPKPWDTGTGGGTYQEPQHGPHVPPPTILWL